MANYKKYHRAYVDVRTSLPRAELAALAAKVAGAIDGMAVDLQNEAGLRVIHKNFFRVTLITFVVDVDASEQGSHARSRIIQAITSRPTFMYIPVGPRSMNDYKSYRRFMELFARAAREVDPNAKVSLVEVVQ